MSKQNRQDIRYQQIPKTPERAKRDKNKAKQNTEYNAW